jgi:hypothetical protein
MNREKKNFSLYKKKKKWNSETGEAEKLQSGYGKGHGM